jgi:LPXTG-motif cell wall-anchored protein
MRARVVLLLTVVLLVLSPIATAWGQGAVTEPGGTTEIGTPRGRTPRTPGTGRTAGTPRGQRTPGTGRTAGTPRGERTPGTGRTPGTVGTPRTLPATGSSATTLAVDAIALVALGGAMLRLRRRYA